MGEQGPHMEDVSGSFRSIPRTSPAKRRPTGERSSPFGKKSPLFLAYMTLPSPRLTQRSRPVTSYGVMLGALRASLGPYDENLTYLYSCMFESSSPSLATASLDRLLGVFFGLNEVNLSLHWEDFPRTRLPRMTSAVFGRINSGPKGVTFASSGKQVGHDAWPLPAGRARYVSKPSLTTSSGHRRAKLMNETS
jgi:hypothetical protein